MVRPLFIPAFWPRPHPFQVQIVPVRDISQLVWLLYVAVTSLKFPRTAVIRDLLFRLKQHSREDTRGRRSRRKDPLRNPRRCRQQTARGAALDRIPPLAQEVRKPVGRSAGVRAANALAPAL